MNNNLLFRCAASSLKCVPNPPVAGVVATNPRRGIHCQSDTHFPLWAANSLLCRSLNRVPYLLETPLSGCVHPSRQVIGPKSRARLRTMSTPLILVFKKGPTAQLQSPAQKNYQESTHLSKKKDTHTHTNTFSCRHPVSVFPICNLITNGKCRGECGWVGVNVCVVRVCKRVCECVLCVCVNVYVSI